MSNSPRVSHSAVYDLVTDFRRIETLMAAAHFSSCVGRMFSAICGVGLLLAVAACGTGADNPSASSTGSTMRGPAEPVLTPVVGAVMFAPTPFAGSDGQKHLVYEVSLTNFTDARTMLTGLRVVDPASNSTVLDLSTAELAARTKPVGGADTGGVAGTPPGYSNVLRAGQNGTVFLHVTIPADRAVPTTLTHQLDIVADALPPGAYDKTETLAPVTVGDGEVPVLGPPLAGSNFIAADACCDAVRHTHALLPVDGSAYLAQRYAVDWEQADDQRRIFVGDASKPESYKIFGADAFAVADGTVVQSRNDLPEQTPGEYPKGISIADADGNNLVLDIGNGFFVNYAHMQPGSVRFKAGDRVKRGDVIGKVGNTGNSVAPHLHVHVMNGPSFIASQGVPSVTDSFTVTGQVASTADFDRSEGTGVPLVLKAHVATGNRTDEMVLDQLLVTFPKR